MKPNLTQLQKDLTARRTALALQVDIPSMAAYALEWSKLAADFEAAGWVHNAAICFSNAKRYGAMDEAGYKRLLEEIPVRLEKDENLKECLICGTYTRHVLLCTPEGGFIGWMCGCGTLAQMTAVESISIPQAQAAK